MNYFIYLLTAVLLLSSCSGSQGTTKTLPSTSQKNQEKGKFSSSTPQKNKEKETVFSNNETYSYFEKGVQEENEGNLQRLLNIIGNQFLSLLK